MLSCHQDIMEGREAGKVEHVWYAERGGGRVASEECPEKCVQSGGDVISAHLIWNLVNELMMLASGVLVAAGWYQIRRRRVRTHRRLMLAGASFAAAFFVSYLFSTLLIGDSLYDGPGRYATAYQSFLQIHVVLATVAAILGVVTLRRAFLRRFSRHRRIAPWTAVLWFISAASGLGVFLILFVIFPSHTSTTSIFTVLFH